jgi:KDO2-lipid IV(A) lauroyltransferase
MSGRTSGVPVVKVSVMLIHIRDLANPKYWLFLLVLLPVWLVAQLPYGWQISIGKVYGRFISKVSKKSRKAIATNIKLCFPQLSELEQQSLIDESAEQLGISIAETFLVWFRNNKEFIRDRVTLDGVEHFNEAIQSGRPIILLACHYGCVDLNGVLLSSLDRGEKKFVATFRQTDDFVNRFLASVRSQYCDLLLPSIDQRNIVKNLKNKNIIWYAPDIEVKGKSAEFVDFMGVKASTTVAISRLAKITDALVLPVAHYREDESPAYRLKVFPALAQFPSADLIRDTRRINEAIEQIIAPNPTFYWWVIKRFKRRPNGEKSPY